MIENNLDTYLQDTQSGLALLIDVREPNEYEIFHVPDAILWPLSEIEELSESELVEKLKAFKGKHLYVHCRSGTRALYAIQKLKPFFDPITRLPQSPEQICLHIQNH